jgi:hypothetical protein
VPAFVGNLTANDGSCTASAAGSIRCDIGSLAVGQQATISFSATPTAAGAVGNKATIAMAAADTQPANSSVTVTVQPK